MSISPSTLSLEPGASGNITLARPAADGASAIALAATTGNVTVSIVRSGGFEGAVTVTVEGFRPASRPVPPRSPRVRLPRR